MLTVKVIVLLLIMLMLGAVVTTATHLATVSLLSNIIGLIGPIAFLIVFTSTLLIFFTFFLSAFSKGLRAKIKIQPERLSWSELFSRLLASAIWVSAATLIVSSFKVLLQVAESVDPHLFWCLIVVFALIIFVVAYKQDKREKILGNIQTNWHK